MKIEKRRKLAIQACKEIGKILLDNFGGRLQVRSKGDRDLVTNIDQRADRKVTQLIKRHFPQDGIISEESHRCKSASGFSWIIDPIDGTHNFVHNIEIFGTSVAVALQGEVIVGTIYMPRSDELYVAQRGCGAYCNGRRISVSKRKIKQATLVYDSTIRFNKSKMLKHLGELADKVFNVRMFGSTVRSLSYLACGKVEAEIEFSDKPWDFAAGLLLVEEAGGQSTDFQGKPWNINTKRYIASNGIIHQELLRIIRR